MNREINVPNDFSLGGIDCGSDYWIIWSKWNGSVENRSHFCSLWFSFALSQMKLHETLLEMQLTPFSILLRVLLDQLQTKDQARIFTQPVDVNEVNLKVTWTFFVSESWRWNNAKQHFLCGVFCWGFLNDLCFYCCIARFFDHKGQILQYKL